VKNLGAEDGVVLAAIRQRNEGGFFINDGRPAKITLTPPGEYELEGKIEMEGRTEIKTEHTANYSQGSYTTTSKIAVEGYNMMLRQDYATTPNNGSEKKESYAYIEIDSGFTIRLDAGVIALNAPNMSFGGLIADLVLARNGRLRGVTTDVDERNLVQLVEDTTVTGNTVYVGNNQNPLAMMHSADSDSDTDKHITVGLYVNENYNSEQKLAYLSDLPETTGVLKIGSTALTETQLAALKALI
jgi:hypothetical protein